MLFLELEEVLAGQQKPENLFGVGVLPKVHEMEGLKVVKPLVAVGDQAHVPEHRLQEGKAAQAFGFLVELRQGSGQERETAVHVVVVVNLPLLLETVRGGVVPVEEAPLGTLGPLDLDQKALSIGLQSHEDAWKELPGAVKALQAQEIALVGVDVGDITLVAVSNDDLPPTLHGTEPALVQLQSPGVELPERDRNVDGLVGVSLVGFANELPDLLLKEGLALGSQGETDKLAEEGLPLLEALEALLEVPLPFPVGVDAEETRVFGKSIVDGEVGDLVVLGRGLPGDLVGSDLLGGEGGKE